jgi:TonB family protein
MEHYAPIHPEHPFRRAAVAVAVALTVHAGLFALREQWVRRVLETTRKREAEQPKAVALARIDAARWEQNRRANEPEADLVQKRLPMPSGGAARGVPGQRARDGREERTQLDASPQGREARAGPEPSPPAPEPGAASSVGPTLNLRPLPLPSSPLDLGVKGIGDGGRPFAEGTSFGGLTIQHPEAWRYTSFINRAVEEMNAALRYKLGDPLLPSVREKLSPRYYFVAEIWVAVAIDRDGRVRDARVRRSTGMADLDELILRTIRESSPFANFPPGLLDGSGIYSDSWRIYYMR